MRRIDDRVSGSKERTKNHTESFHGLTRSAPGYVIGVGYSIRFDDLF